MSRLLKLAGLVVGVVMVLVVALLVAATVLTLAFMLTRLSGDLFGSLTDTGEAVTVGKLLAPLEPKVDPDKTPADQPPETEAVKAERLRLTEQAAISEGRIKQCEVVIARADQLLERLTKIRGEVMLQTLLHRGLSPLSPETWRRVGPEFSAAIAGLSRALIAWRAQGLNALGSGEQDLTPLIWWSLLTIVLWWIGHAARRRFGRGDLAEPGPRDRTIAAAIDGLGLVLVPVLAVWLIGKLLLASQPPAPLDGLIGELTARLITFLLAIGLIATTLSPLRPAWRVLPFTDAAARNQSAALRHLMAYGLAFDFVHLALTSGIDHHPVILDFFGLRIVRFVHGRISITSFSNVPEVFRICYMCEGQAIRWGDPNNCFPIWVS